MPEAGSFERQIEWMVPDIKTCVDHGRRHGVIVGLQRHNRFLETADETVRAVEAVNSEWFGVILDVGSLRRGDPCAEIEKLVPCAVTWQVKQKIWCGAREVPTDVGRTKAIVDRVGYRGVPSVETSGSGDPRVKVSAVVAEIRRHFA